VFPPGNCAAVPSLRVVEFQKPGVRASNKLCSSSMRYLVQPRFTGFHVTILMNHRTTKSLSKIEHCVRLCYSVASVFCHRL